VIISQTVYSQENARVQFKQLDGINNLLSIPGDENWDNRMGFPQSRWEESGYAIAVVDSEIFLGGSFAGSKYLVQWDVNGWSDLGGPNITVNALAVIGNDLYVGGLFVEIDSVVVNRIAKWNHLTQKWSALKTDTSIGIDSHVDRIGSIHNVQALAARGHELYVGGKFTYAGGIVANNIVKWNSLSNTWSPLGDGINGTVDAIAVCNGEIYVGGLFSLAGGVPANNIAKWNGHRWSALGSGVKGIVYAIGVFGKEVYVGGSFSEAGALMANNIAKWNPVDKRWSALGGNGMNNGSKRVVLAIGSNKKFVYVSGDVDLINGQKAQGIAKWDPVNNLWSTLGSGVYGVIKSIVMQGNDVLVAGTILKVGGKDSKNFGVWHEPYGRPVIAALPELRFNEDRILFHPIRDWHPFVTDDDDPDSTLKFAVLSGKQVKATRHPRRYAFAAPTNWFGRDTLQVIVTDRSQLADTTSLVIIVDPTNDKPKWTGLPDSLSFKTGASAQLKMWDLVEDVETPDSLLLYRFVASKSGLRWNFHRATGTLVLTAPQFHGNARLFVKAGDGKAAAYDTIAVRVEMPNDILAAIEKQNSTEPIPTEFVLQQNYPNPFNPTTLIRFGLPQDTEVKLEIFNLAGQHVATLLNERKAAGYHEVLFDAVHLPSGNYFSVLRAGETKLARRIVLIK